MAAKKSKEKFINDANNLHLQRYDYSKVDYITSHVKINIMCKVHGEFNQTPANHLKGQGCPKCMAISKFDTLRLTNDKIDEDLLKNKRNIKRLGSYVNIGTNIDWNCLICNNQWSASPNSIRQGCSCPVCNDTRLSNKDIDGFLNQHSIKIKRLDNYNNNYTKINWQCLVCNNIWLAKSSEITRMGKRTMGSGCPECACGRNEKIVGMALDQLKIEIAKLRIDLPNGQKIFPDFYLPTINAIIEYNGIQHYEPTRFGSMTKIKAEYCLIKQQQRDMLLRQYCNDNNILLLEIDGRKYKGIKLRNFVLNYFGKGNSYE